MLSSYHRYVRLCNQNAPFTTFFSIRLSLRKIFFPKNPAAAYTILLSEAF
ncbi:hypothetical protein HMPREF1548_06438 [Clostridium sp. KLE 1755]|nr:hypothetical protein HMPREF1548_06438 [Clostridium sp. KLE 1755]